MEPRFLDKPFLKEIEPELDLLKGRIDKLESDNVYLKNNLRSLYYALRDGFYEIEVSRNLSENTQNLFKDIRYKIDNIINSL